MAVDPTDWQATMDSLQQQAVQQQQELQQQSAPQVNPLAKHFRTPAIYIKLPSGGNYWPPGSLVPTETGEYPVYPMTAKDEVIFNNPDALLNGQAVVDVIQSCIPNIKDAWEMPSSDVDTVLIALRIASYGEEMDFDTACPECEEESSFSIDLRHFLDKSLNVSLFNQGWQHNGLTFHLKPQNYRVVNKVSMESYETQRLMLVIDNADTPEEEKLAQVNKIISELSAKTIEISAGVIEKIITPDGLEVTNPQYIAEFLSNTDRKTFNFVGDKVDEITKNIAIEEIDTTCPECNHAYKVPFTFDNANFFG